MNLPNAAGFSFSVGIDTTNYKIQTAENNSTFCGGTFSTTNAIIGHTITTSHSSNDEALISASWEGIGRYIYNSDYGVYQVADRDDIEVVIDGGAAPITTGTKGHYTVPYNCVIYEATLVADQTGDIVVDILKCPFASFTEGFETITSATPLTISSGNTVSDTTFSNWNKYLNAGDVLTFKVRSANTIQNVSLNLKITRTMKPITAVPVAFTPASIPELYAWYDASNGVYSDAGTTLAANGANVAQWNDLSGIGNHLTNTFYVTSATFDSNGLNNRPAVMLANTYQIQAPAAKLGGGQQLSCFVVGQVNTNTDWAGGLLQFFEVHGETGQSFDMYSWSGGPDWNTRRYATPLGQGGLSAFTTPYRFGIIFSGTDYIPYLNNIPKCAPGAVSSTGLFGELGILRVGNRYSGWAGPISEIVLYSTALNNEQMQKLDNYFKAKWGF
jgi:hypothetical protein